MTISVSDMPKTYKGWANGYKSLVDTSYKKGRDYRKGCFYMDSTENWDDRLVEMGSTGGMSAWATGDSAAQTDIEEGYSKTFTQVRYGEKVPIGSIAERFQGFDVRLTKRATKGIGKDAYLLEQGSAFSVINYGFSTTNTYLTGVNGSTVSALGPDSKNFFSVSHPCSPNNSTTWSNALADNAAAGEDSLKDMIENLHNQLDERGNRKHYGQSGYTWYVPLEQFAAAGRIIGSELRPDTEENSINMYNGSFDGRPITVKWVPYLSDSNYSPSATRTTAHYLMANDAVEDENLVILKNRPFFVDDYTNDDTDIAYVRGRTIFSVGFLSGRGWVGSQGTGTGTYTS